MANGAGVPDQFEGRVCALECLFEQAADLERVHRDLRMGFRLSTLPKINFREIREHETSQQRAFEELCYQLVPTVHALPPGARLERRRALDRGIEFSSARVPHAPYVFGRTPGRRSRVDGAR